LVTVIDGHPATLAWLGAVIGHATVPLGVEHFGQTGTIADLYRHFALMPMPSWQRQTTWRRAGRSDGEAE